ncbi:zinc finger CCCH domain-containing protein ZFN-like [Pyrus communis]|uniref:zinc finger CCCH domain-containing protein ZFN-like n=1 Tax=Pyrus communis TaxID=23211 RepID=UPI0035BFE378
MGNQELLLTEKLMQMVSTIPRVSIKPVVYFGRVLAGVHVPTLQKDQNICTHYSRYGICKFGPACKFDHPLHISSSTTSGPDHRLPFSDSATTNGAGMAGSRNGTDVTSQPQPVQ